MLKVTLWGSLKDAAGGETEFEVEARTAKELLARLEERHPELGPVFKRGVSLSINGVMRRDPDFSQLPENAEIFILPRMAGG